MPHPRVTIVTPSFNQAGYLRATIESVLSQRYPALEYIVMDGGSTDGSAAIAAEYSSRLQWISEPDRGQSDAINKGFRLASGSIVAWLNSDDVYLPGAIEKAVAAFAEAPFAGAVYGDGFLIDAAGRITGKFPYTQLYNLWRLLHRSDYILQQSTFFRADVLCEVGCLREDLHYTMDWDLLLRIAKRYPLEYTPEPLACIREHGEAKTAKGGLERTAEIRRMLREHTGERVPGAWVTYAAETYARLAREKIAATRLPGNGLLQVLCSLTGDLFVFIGARENQGIFENGWAGPGIEWLLPAGHGALLIEGELPGNGWLDGQALSITCDGRDLGTHSIGFGDFRLALPFGPRPEQSLARVRIRATHSFVPSGHEPAVRDYAYRLRRIGWSSWRGSSPAVSSPPAQ